MKKNFRDDIQSEFIQWLQKRQERIQGKQYKIDLHCHDKNSSVPDELYGRILRLPETWVTSEQLIENLKINKVDALTITNHNNSKSCWELIDQGKDVLVGAEFTCRFPEYHLFVHVLTYGFTREQETVLNQKRHNIYDFLRYARELNIPTVLAHPLFFYSGDKPIPQDITEKFALIFERYEVFNGQRDPWQNLMTAKWVESLTEEKIQEYSVKHNINPYEFCVDPYTKGVTGGSDDHNSIFAGSVGTIVSIDSSISVVSIPQAVVHGIREKNTVPYGIVGGIEKLTTAVLDYFSQVALNIEDPGLIRILLHKGTLKDKLACLAIGNTMMEINRHKNTTRFLKAFHCALSGTRPGIIQKIAVSKDYKPLIKYVDTIAQSKLMGAEKFNESLQTMIPQFFKELNSLIVKRVHQKIGNPQTNPFEKMDLETFIEQLEVSAYFRNLGKNSTAKNGTQAFNVGDFLDHISFPVLFSIVLGGAYFTSCSVLFKARKFVDKIAEDIGEMPHPKRVLWLTDSLFDNHGVSTVLQQALVESRERELPIDFLTIYETELSSSHLHVLKPVTEFEIPNYKEQKVRVPNILEVLEIFYQGGYDRIICSTELLMGPIALFMKHAFHIPVYFYMHTDWMEFFTMKTSLTQQFLDRIRRSLRAFYSAFDGVFVLNEDHRQWLTSKDMAIPQENIMVTAHWADSSFKPQPSQRDTLFPMVEKDTPLILFAGRLSTEKGVFDILKLYKHFESEGIKGQFVVAGVGPEEKSLKLQMPNAHFLGWVDKHDLPTLFNSVDLLILPSTFDTFGCVVLEALSCGLPAAAYRCKGPKEIFKNHKWELLADDYNDLVARVEDYIKNLEMHKKVYRNRALSIAQRFHPELIMDRLLEDVGLRFDSGNFRYFTPIYPNKTTEKESMVYTVH